MAGIQHGSFVRVFGGEPAIGSVIADIREHALDPGALMAELAARHDMWKCIEAIATSFLACGYALPAR